MEHAVSHTHEWGSWISVAGRHEVRQCLSDDMCREVQERETPVNYADAVSLVAEAIEEFEATVGEPPEAVVVPGSVWWVIANTTPDVDTMFGVKLLNGNKVTRVAAPTKRGD